MIIKRTLLVIAALTMHAALPVFAMNSFCSWFDSKVETEAEKVLGYDPQIVFEQPSNGDDQKKTPVICLHGFGGQGDNYKGWSNKWLRPVVFFNFPEIVSSTAINIGQEPDAKTVLYVLSQMLKKGYTKTHLWGLSRGGACGIQLLHILCNPELYKGILQELNIENEEVQKLKGMIVNNDSKVIFAHPLLSVPSVTKKLSRDTLQSTFGSSIKDTVVEQSLATTGGFGSQTALSVFTKYSMSSRTPFEMLGDLLLTKEIAKKLNIYIALAEKDEIIGDEYNKAICDLMLDQRILNNDSGMLIGGYDHNDFNVVIKQAKSILEQ